MAYSAQINIYEEEVINIIKKGQEEGRTDLTVSDDMLNNYFLNHAYFIDKKEFYANGAMYKYFIDNYGNIYEFRFNLGSDKYWIGYCICQKYNIELQEIIIDTIKLITINNENHFKNTISGIIKINEQNENYNSNIYNLIILEINKLKEENEQLKNIIMFKNKQINKKNRKYYDNFICPITMEIMKDPVICSDGHTYERSAIETWLSTKSHSPITRAIIPNNSLIPNIVLRNIIQEFEKDHKMCF
jgi:hypothetical protein